MDVETPAGPTPHLARVAAITIALLSLLLYYYLRSDSPLRPSGDGATAPTLDPSSTTMRDQRAAATAAMVEEAAAGPSDVAGTAGKPRAFDEGLFFGEPGTFMISTPTLQEGYGWARGLYGTWASEVEDRASTTQAAEVLTDAMRAEEIEPRAYHVRCSQSLCRMRVRFRTSSELNRLSKIRPAEKVDYVVTMPQRLDDESLDVSVYWGQNGVDPRRWVDERAGAP